MANRAKNECFEDGTLPNVESNDYSRRFLSRSRGLRRESQRTSDHIAEAIDDLWQDSKFSLPLKEVITESHKKAAFVALDSAIDKLDNYLELFRQLYFSTVQPFSIDKLKGELSSLTKEFYLIT